MKLSTRTLLPLLLLLSLACGGGDGGGSGPTAPPPPTGFQALFTLVLLPNFTQGGVVEATLSLDGREIVRRSWADLRGGCLADCQLQVNLTDVSAGSHTLSATIVRQTRASLGYTVFGVALVTRSSNGERRTVEFERRNPTLRAGETLSYDFTL